MVSFVIGLYSGFIVEVFIFGIFRSRGVNVFLICFLVKNFVFFLYYNYEKYIKENKILSIMKEIVLNLMKIFKKVM